MTQAAKVAVALAGGEEFGIDIGRVVEILKVPRVYSLPHLPSFFSGVVNIRGEVIPLVDLRKRMGLVAAAPAKERVIVVRLDREKVGLLVDGVKEIIALEGGEIIKPHSMFKGLRTEYMRGIGRRGDSIIILLNLDTILTLEEKVELERAAKTLEVSGAGNEEASE